MLWYLTEVEGWERPAHAWTPERCLGTAIHAGIAAYWRATTSWGQRIDPITESTRALEECWEETVEGLEIQTLRVKKTVKAVIRWIEKEMPSAQPMMIEKSLGFDGHTTPDLVTKEEGNIVISDWKYSHYLPADRMAYRLEGAARNHQFLHYVWAVEDYLKQPVYMFRKVVIAGGPQILIKQENWYPQPEEIKAWLAQSCEKSHQMGLMRTDPTLVYRREEGCKPFGEKWPCEMFDACWTCHGDRKMMEQFYLRKEGFNHE